MKLPRGRMQARRSASSTLDDLWSTAAAIPPAELHAVDRRTRTKGMTRRGERIFNVVSSLITLLFAIGWSWSIALARSGVTVRPASETTGILTSALTEHDAPSMAYLTDAALAVVTPLRGESGKLRARIGQPGEPIPGQILPSGTVATYSAGARAESTAVLNAPKRTGIWSLAIALGNAIKPVADF